MSALAIAGTTTVTRPAPARPGYLGRARGARLRPVAGAADPVTVTISIDGGSVAGRDRVLAALRELVEAAGSEATVELAAAPPEPGSISVDPRPRTVVRDGWPLHLSRLEYDLLLFLARHPHQVFTRSQLLAQVWGHTHTTVRTVDVHISRLRTKLGDQELITTVYGLGYRLSEEAAISVAGE
jgi:DNA-binding winged helix-turn-helix (wHTH) protein